jgi:hypothetical protein
VTRTPEEWKAFHVTPYTRPEMLYSAISDIAELAEQLRVYREAEDARIKMDQAYEGNEDDYYACVVDWQAKDGKLRKMRGEA